MPIFKAFKALVPDAGKASVVSAPPYDVVSFEESKKIAISNPETFIKISRSEVDLPDGTDPYSEAVYEKALENFEKIVEQAPYTTEQRPFHYIYRLQMGEHVQFGIIGLASVKDYIKNRIKKHEKTRKDKEDDRTRHISKVRSHSGPVLLTYRDNAQIDRIVAEHVKGNPPFIEFVAENGVKNSLWRIFSPELGKLFEAISEFYIADGHHRAASAFRTAELLSKTNPSSDAGFNFFLAVAFPASQMKILPYNRILKDWNGKSEADFMKFLKSNFKIIREGEKTPAGKGDVCVCIGKKWTTINLNSLKDKNRTPEENLDVAILQKHLLNPFFGIQDPRTDKRIDFIGGIRGTSELEKALAEGRAVVAFSMFPVTTDDLMEISDTNGIMPPKSTWFEPKLRDGLVLDRF